ncbi:peptidylprolyl isomerase [Occallatibacter riparius]|uniref:Peptidylprolyl isomerase n=1 Tax=Occallatibacter riparius TaxID=1002689 RepID=A0A9J7BM95_9BACT|nr:peptidylprolyl isomerase [Occallatibacter riparius]UWZ84004.1 peptidylprolyl isomerase [Occallatibacter riparius]
MTLNFLRIPAVTVLSAALLATPALAQSRPAEPASPYGGVTVEDIIARVNDQIITRSDYDRSQKELDDEARKAGASMQQISEAHRDLLRNLIDQQLWISKGKELGITGETELINRLNEIRKQYNLSSLEDLEKAAQEQGVSYEDFKANIRNQIITQQVMRDEVGRHISFTPGEVQRYYEQHKQEYVQPESVKLSEILVGTPADATDAQVAAAKTKADDAVAKLRGGADFTQVAKSVSEGQTAGQGGDLGTYKRGQLNKIFEDATFSQPTGTITDPIRTKQGFVIFKVVQHNSGGVQEYKDVEQQVEQDYYGSKMEPAIREYLTKMREDAYIDIAPGFTDSGASSNKRVNPIAYSQYTPPQPKKKKKVERTRFRENTHFRSKTSMPGTDAAAAGAEAPAASGAAAGTQTASAATHTASAQPATQKPGKKEKIRYGQAPTKTLPSAAPTQTEDAGATGQSVGQGAQVAQADAPVEPEAPEQKKTRYSDRARVPKDKKQQAAHPEKASYPAQNPAAAPDAAEVADRQTQSAALGLKGDTTKKKKKQATTTSEKTRLQDKKKSDQPQQQTAPVQPTPIGPVQGAPAPGQPAQPPAPAPSTAPTQPQQ